MEKTSDGVESLDNKTIDTARILYQKALRLLPCACSPPSPLSLWYHTLRDIPPSQLADRLWFEGRRRLHRRLPDRLQRLWVGAVGSVPPWRPDYLTSLRADSPPQRGVPPATLTLTFLGDSRPLAWPIPWNSPAYPRLWQFNLHYFDWLREDLEHVYSTGQWSAAALDRLWLLTDWIDRNPLGQYDGWHPYPTSLRLVNWTWLLAACPDLASPAVQRSLWWQLCHLHHYQETCFGGNHWFENLAALIIAGLNFTGPRAEAMVSRALHHLTQQLTVQVLADGGHYERSPMYHLLLLKRLGEVMVALGSAHWPTPPSLASHLAAMARFAQGLRLANGTYPLWNDCAYDIAEPLDEGVAWARALLRPDPQPLSVFNQRLIHSAPSPAPAADLELDRKPAPMTVLAASGYGLWRSGLAAEISIDAAPPCPRALPAHAHADCLSFDLHWRGQPLIVETGTSQYGNDARRQRERGTLSHNTVALATLQETGAGRRAQAPGKGEGETGPVFDQTQVWGGFRAARKAQPRHLRWGETAGWRWLGAGHDGYDWLGAGHHRWLGTAQGPDFTLVICDWLWARSPYRWLHRLHLGPAVTCTRADRGWHLTLGGDRFQLTLWVLAVSPAGPRPAVSELSPDSWYAPRFGCRQPRSVLTSLGEIGPLAPLTLVCTLLHHLPQGATAPVPDLQGTAQAGHLELPGHTPLHWHLDTSPSPCPPPASGLSINLPTPPICRATPGSTS